jgi:hypothetical protein
MKGNKKLGRTHRKAERRKDKVMKKGKTKDRQNERNKR